MTSDLKLTTWQAKRAARDGIILLTVEKRVTAGLLPEEALATLKERLALFWCDMLYGDALRVKESTQELWHFDRRVSFPSLALHVVYSLSTRN